MLTKKDNGGMDDENQEQVVTYYHCHIKQKNLKTLHSSVNEYEVLSVYVIKPLRVQYGINLHECVLKISSKLYEHTSAN